MIEHETTTFIASIARIATLADGGLRVTFDLPEDAIVQVAELMAVRQAGYAVNVMVVPLKNSEEQSNDRGQALETRPKRESKWATAEK